MLNWLLAIDIMGGGGSAPNNIPVPNDDGINRTILFIIVGIVCAIILATVFIYFLVIEPKKENKKSNNKEHK